MPLLGGVAAAPSVAVWRRDKDFTKSEIPAAELAGWLAKQTTADQSAAERILRNWQKRRAFPGVKGDGPALMGIVNVTNDSFYAPSRISSETAAVAMAKRAVKDGAGIIDVGGQSTRPHGGPVSLVHELGAVLPVLEQIAALGVPTSVDTLRPAVAQAALAEGALIVNDVSGLMPPIVAGNGALIIGDMRGNPSTMQKWPRSRFGVFDIYDWLAKRIDQYLAAGMTRDQLAIDPGFGFGKAVSHNQALIHHLPLFLGLGVTIVVGVSRKGSLGYLSGTPSATDRLPASLAAAMAAARGGASILRVHDVAATRQMLQVVDIFV
jgi:dihydropteroate synthase